MCEDWFVEGIKNLRTHPQNSKKNICEDWFVSGIKKPTNTFTDK